MIGKKDFTTVSVHRRTHARLTALKLVPRHSLDSIINELINHYEHHNQIKKQKKHIGGKTP